MCFEQTSSRAGMEHGATPFRRAFHSVDSLTIGGHRQSWQQSTLETTVEAIAINSAIAVITRCPLGNITVNSRKDASGRQVISRLSGVG
jgi:hypothetical protein